MAILAVSVDVAGDYNDEIGQSSCKRCPAVKVCRRRRR